jgi:hypothetical protein
MAGLDKDFAVAIGRAGETVTVRVRRLADGAYLCSVDGAFEAVPHSSSLSMPEDPANPGIYRLRESREAWDDGEYEAIVTVNFYAAAVAIASLEIVDDAIVNKLDTRKVAAGDTLASEETLRGDAFVTATVINPRPAVTGDLVEVRRGDVAVRRWVLGAAWAIKDKFLLTAKKNRHDTAETPIIDGLQLSIYDAPTMTVQADFTRAHLATAGTYEFDIVGWVAGAPDTLPETAVDGRLNILPAVSK